MAAVSFMLLLLYQSLVDAAGAGEGVDVDADVGAGADQSCALVAAGAAQEEGLLAEVVLFVAGAGAAQESQSLVAAVEVVAAAV